MNRRESYWLDMLAIAGGYTEDDIKILAHECRRLSIVTPFSMCSILRFIRRQILDGTWKQQEPVGTFSIVMHEIDRLGELNLAGLCGLLE